MIVPLECEYFALRGVALLKTTIDKVHERLNPDLEIDGVLGTMFDGRTLHSREVMERLVQAWGDTVFHTVIRRTVKFSDSTVAGEPITTYASASPRCRRLPPARQGGAGAVARRVSLPAADDLFRPTRAPTADSRPRPERPTADGRRPGQASPTTAHADGRRPRRPSGRVRHDEKMTVYVTADELLDLEHARLRAARASTAWPSTAGRLVREAIALVLADLEENGADSCWSGG